ncbi:TetR family transcriptional regulator C-terminal domain-containing protein [Paracoccus sp. MBLB3053]|uniref:TetR family transcriptional regulator C-terminal domain-containing protein n=1 Tax=Paracoccus aurantius TaxID=3073814 RepID=A0ABU2HW84_9RHOB|nr:TetR family transcriptional regulator C-terminal domain-containing protein [Paracoccus sp. MBLB3053]MDS9469327.1 TetR family transcriptional regulator C-terminal domain-containing protein [Paracoccus sp. MBLB3053]
MKSFRRMQDFDRRAELIRATLDCIADHGIQGTTVRAVASYAGVSIGLIRHHFMSKENMIRAAYRETVEMLTRKGRDVIEASDLPPHDRLARFVAASIGGEVSDPRLLSLWAAFMSQVNVDQEMARIHDEGHLPYRTAIEPMVAAILQAEGRTASDAQCVRAAIAINAILDGLWLEGCLQNPGEHPEDYVAIGLEATEALLQTKLPRLSKTKE